MPDGETVLCLNAKKGVKLPSKQLVARSNRARDTISLKTTLSADPDTLHTQAAYPFFQSTPRKVTQNHIAPDSALITSTYEDGDMITIAEGLKAYRLYAQASGHSKSTIRWIIGAVTYFSEFLGDKQDLSQITANDLRRFIIAFGERRGYVKHPLNWNARN